MTGRLDHGADDWVARCRELFLTDLWGLVVDEDEQVDGNPSWIDSWIRSEPNGAESDDPTTAALYRILDSGADVDDLTDVVRTMQHEIIYNVYQLLDDPALFGIRRDTPPEEVQARWQLTAIHPASPTGSHPIGELHSELDEHDPSGRGGEPRGRPIPARLPGQPLYARVAVAQARAGDRLAAIKTWRSATGSTTATAKAAIDELLDGDHD
jgi:hypothetical protein